MKSKKILAIRWVAWSISILIMVFIFMSSAATAEVSSKTSGGLIRSVLGVVVSDFDTLSESEAAEMVASLQHFVRKLAHFLTYFALGVSLFTAFYTYEIRPWLKYFLSLLICLLYAASDELHQAFVPGRGPQISDVALDFAGSVTGILAVTLIIAVFSAIRKRRNGKMRKKELMKRLSELVTTVEKLNRVVKDLEADKEELKAQIKALEEKGVNISQPVAEKAVPVEKEDSSLKENVPTESSGFTVRIVDEVELSEASEDGNINPMEYGAVIIGKITVESAKCCDIISKNGGENVKELLSLVMGKSELSKAEILNIAMSDLDDEQKKELIDKELTDATDYFKSVSEQNI